MDKLEELEKRIKELESKQKSNQQMFGRSYSQVGDSNSDFLIKTRGQVKIQYGSKFIDLIKDGKVNADVKFIYKGSVGSKDGIYIDGENVWLKVGDSDPINLIGEIGMTYVSFLGEQETSPDEKHTALINIGILAETQDDVNIKSGIVYIESENKLYLVNNGNIEEFKIDFPNPFPEQFIIAKNDSKQGALLIQGNGKENSLAFDGLYIYKDSNSIINSDSDLDIYISDSKKVNFKSYQTTFYNDVISSMFKSPNASSENGFRLYFNGESYLEIDNLIWRNQPSNINISNDEHWFNISNIINSIDVFEELEEDEDDTIEEEDTIDEDELYNKCIITLLQNNLFNEGDILISYLEKEKEYPEEDESDESDDEFEEDIDEYTIIELIPVYFKVLTSQENTIVIESFEDLTEDEIYSLEKKILYRISPENPIRIKNNNLEIVNVSEELEFKSKLQIGDISKEIIVNEESQQINGSGIYSDIGFFKESGYTSDYILESDDNSSRFASTEWVRKNIASTGPIILFSGVVEYVKSTFSDNYWKISDKSLYNESVQSLNIELKSSGSANYLEITLNPKENCSITPYSISTSIIKSFEESLIGGEMEGFFTNATISGGVHNKKIYLIINGGGDNNVQYINLTIFGNN